VLSLRYRYKLLLNGDEKPFDVILEVVVRIKNACNFLINHSDSSTDQGRKLIEEWKSIIWKGYGDDLIGRLVDSMVVEVEKVCTPPLSSLAPLYEIIIIKLKCIFLRITKY
jgi:hypothetical protein